VIFSGLLHPPTCIRDFRTTPYLKNANEYLNLDGGKLFIGFSNTAGYPQTFEDIAKRYNWTIHLRNEIKSDTTPVMHIGMYELIKIE